MYENIISPLQIYFSSYFFSTYEYNFSVYKYFLWYSICFSPCYNIYYFPFMTIFSTPYLSNKSLDFTFAISLPLLTLLTMIHRLSTWFSISPPSLQLFASYLFISLIPHIPAVAIPLYTCPSSHWSCCVLNAAYSVQFFSKCIPLISALLLVLLLSLTS